MNDRDDAALLRDWAAGDAHAGNALFDRHFASVKGFFARKVGDDVEDLVQHTFMACMEGLGRFRHASTFRTFLFGVARNVLRDYVRVRVRQRRGGGLTDTRAVDLGQGPSTLMAMRQDKRLLLEALRRLPLDTQILLELAYWESLSSSEIGEVLGINGNTARSRLRRSRELLESALKSATADERSLRTTMNNLESWAASLRESLAEGADCDSTRPSTG